MLVGCRIFTRNIDRLKSWLSSRRWYPLRGINPSRIVTDYLGHGYLAVLATVDEMEVFSIVKSANDHFLEAELLPNFYSKLDRGELRGITVREFTNSRLPETPNEFSLEVMAPEATHVLVKLTTGSETVVAKWYKVISSTNREPEILSYLTTAGFKRVPRLRKVFLYKDKAVGIMEDFINSSVKGCMPFYASATQSITGKESNMLAKLARDLSQMLAKFHSVMSSCCYRWCSPSQVSRQDVNFWVEEAVNGLRRIPAAAIRIIEEKTGTSFRNFVRNVRDYLQTELDIYVGLKKIRTHGDSHLLQTLWDGKQFYLIDFEGEPGRSDARRASLEPATRDLACIVRSLNYIAFFTYMEVKHVGTCEAFDALLAQEDPIAKNIMNWYWQATSHVISEYLHAVMESSDKVIGQRMLTHSFSSDMLVPWIVERAAYELVYESMYAPEHILIPLLEFFIRRVLA